MVICLNSKDNKCNKLRCYHYYGHEVKRQPYDPHDEYPPNYAYETCTKPQYCEHKDEACKCVVVRGKNATSTPVP